MSKSIQGLHRYVISLVEVILLEDFVNNKSETFGAHYTTVTEHVKRDKIKCLEGRLKLLGLDFSLVTKT